MYVETARRWRTAREHFQDNFLHILIQLAVIDGDRRQESRLRSGGASEWGEWLHCRHEEHATVYELDSYKLWL